MQFRVGGVEFVEMIESLDSLKEFTLLKERPLVILVQRQMHGK